MRRASPLDRCLFVLALPGAAGVMLRVVVLLYVDDLLVRGDEPLATEVADAIDARFPTTPGGVSASSHFICAAVSTRAPPAAVGSAAPSISLAWFALEHFGTTGTP